MILNAITEWFAVEVTMTRIDMVVWLLFAALISSVATGIGKGKK